MGARLVIRYREEEGREDFADVGEIVVGGVAGDRSELLGSVREKHVDGVGRHCYFSKHLLRAWARW